MQYNFNIWFRITTVSEAKKMKVRKIDRIAQIDRMIKHQDPLERAHYVRTFKKEYKKKCNDRLLEDICLKNDIIVDLEQDHIVYIKPQTKQPTEKPVHIENLSPALHEMLRNQSLDSQKIRHIHEKYKTTQNTTKVAPNKPIRFEI